MSFKNLSLSIYVSTPTEATIVPTARHIVNAFDLISASVGVERIQGERNPELRNRIWDVSVHPGGPGYEGVVNGIARNFGYLRQNTIQIDLKLHSSGSPLARNPRVDILANRVVLYKDWRLDGTAVIDKTIYIYSTTDEGYFLDDLATSINSSECFSATIFSGIRPNTHSADLVRSTSDVAIRKDIIRADNVIYLPFGRSGTQKLIEGSVSFDDRAIFSTEVTGAPSAEGEYSIDYDNAIIESYSLPDGTGQCSYHFASFPFVADSVPIEIFTLQDDDFVQKLFRQVTLDSGSDVNGLPNTEGSEILHQLFMESKVFWGK
jgi:hypothetical protein